MSGARLLDYGCGSGHSVAFSRYLGWEAEGIEIDPDAVRLARQAALPVSCGSIELLETKRDRYDYIMSSHCVEHVSDVRRLFQAFCTALRPGGVLTIDVPNGASLAVRRYRDYFYYLGMPVHVHLFTASLATLLARNIGFQDITVSTYSRLYTQAKSALLLWRHRFLGGSGVAFGDHGRLASLLAPLIALPGFLRSCERLNGDCLVLTCRRSS